MKYEVCMQACCRQACAYAGIRVGAETSSHAAGGSCLCWLSPARPGMGQVWLFHAMASLAETWLK